MDRILETICEMAVTRLEKRPVEGETSVETSEPRLVRVPPPPQVVLEPHVPIVPSEVGQYVIPPPGMPNLAHMQGGTCND